MADDLSQELADLAADLKAVILDARSRGVDGFPAFTGQRVDLSAPEPPAMTPSSEPRKTRRENVAPPRAESHIQRPLPPAQPNPTPEVVPVVASRLYGTDSDALLAVRRELGGCERCGLCQGRSNLVFGTGNPDADLMIVGEAPGAQEDRKGLPFVGPAGQMLGNMLQHVLGLDRESVYISNAVKCRPPNNRTPGLEEIATCRPFLMQQIQAVKPKIILSLGTPAAQTLLGTTGEITSLRGTWQELDSIPVLPTFHPAYLLRKPELKRLVFQDLKALKSRYDELGGRES